MIYFIRAKGTNYVKIGYSKDDYGVSQRLTALQTGNWHELELMFCFKGEFEEENFLHKFYDKYRVRGEWFDLTKVMKVKNFEKRIVKYFQKKNKKKQEKIEKERRERLAHYNEMFEDICRGIDNMLAVNSERKITIKNLEIYVQNKFIENSFQYMLSRRIFHLASDRKEFKSYELIERVIDFDILPIANNIRKHNNIYQYENQKNNLKPTIK